MAGTDTTSNNDSSGGPPVDPSTGLPLDSNGNEIVQIPTGKSGTLNVSVDPRVKSNQSVNRPGATSITLPSQQQEIDQQDASGALKKPGGQTTRTAPQQVYFEKSPTNASVQQTATVENTIQEEGKWTTTQLKQFASDAIAMGLVTEKNPSNATLAQAWAMVVQEAALQGKTPEDLISAAKVGGGWSSINPTLMPTDFGLSGQGGGAQTTTTQNSTTTHTSYISYMDPATVQGALADAYYRLMGRNPTTAEYQAFLNQVYGYENDANTGKFESGVVLKQNQKIDPKTGNVIDTTTGQVVPESEITRINPSTDTAGQTANAATDTITNNNIVSQRGIGTRGVQFLAGQTAMKDPSYGQYQAATTYFHALQSALSAPGAGMQASGPTVTAP